MAALRSAASSSVAPRETMPVSLPMQNQPSPAETQVTVTVKRTVIVTSP